MGVETGALEVGLRRPEEMSEALDKQQVVFGVEAFEADFEGIGAFRFHTLKVLQ